MTCKDCVNFAECEAVDRPDHAHKMWLIEFWDNAEVKCNAFEKKEDNQDESQF